ncbi:WSC domain-containing protein [uncultured Hyphomonas sp.]|uniref:WSC domain-containing protein n=1 Tax=uncultured Hyphomonas sp. TaxID=225298 RepID=UPI000C638ECF|nr:hypothetical protein [Hyphomonadaceae bacterium]MBA29096.1 hypothetical protein [Hyphomonadaceae bacterium]
MGPDAYPDILTGQQAIHPQETNKWLKNIWDNSQTRIVKSSFFGQTIERKIDPGPEVKAFSLGYLTHAAGDMFGHTFVNNYSGGPFEVLPPSGPENAIKHVVLEGYVDKKLDPSRMGGDFFNAKIDGVENFIYENLVDARRDTVLGNTIFPANAKGGDFSIPHIFSYLRNDLQAEIDGYYAEKARLQKKADSCSYFDPSCYDTAKLNAYMVANGPRTTYMEYWRDDIDNGLKKLPRVSHDIALALFFNKERKADIKEAKKVAQKYATVSITSMAGAPDAVGIVTNAASDVVDAITPDFLLDQIDDLKKELLSTLVEEAMGMSLEELESYLSSPEQYFDSVMTQGSKGERISRADFDRNVLRLNSGGYVDPQNVPALYNTITMSKLVMLEPAEINKVLRDIGSSATLSQPNVMLGFIETLDGDNQWMKGMVFAEDDQTFCSLFKHQEGTDRACGTSASKSNVQTAFLGCYRDENDRDLSGFRVDSNTSTTPEACQKTCSDKGYKYASVQYGISCMCDNDYGKYGKADNCDMACTGDKTQMCGGTWANSVYATGK